MSIAYLLLLVSTRVAVNPGSSSTFTETPFILRATFIAFSLSITPVGYIVGTLSFSGLVMSKVIFFTSNDFRADIVVPFPMHVKFAW